VTSTPTQTAQPAATGTVTVIPATATATPICSLSFSDVWAEYWAFDYIKWSYCRGIISGYSDGTFRPEANTTRGQLAKMVVLAAGFPLVLPAGAPHFSDVPPDQPFYRYIEVAWSHNVVSGYQDGTFQPSALVTRAQLAKMIVQARGLSLVDPPVARFQDVPRESWAYRYVETAAAHSIVSGYDCGAPGESCPGFYYRPNVPATRAQLTKLLYQAFGVPSLAPPNPKRHPWAGRAHARPAPLPASRTHGSGLPRFRRQGSRVV
jgi:hypothetical protein